MTESAATPVRLRTAATPLATLAAHLAATTADRSYAIVTPYEGPLDVRARLANHRDATITGVSPRISRAR